MADVDRRSFLSRSARATGAALLAPSLQGLVACADRTTGGSDAAEELRAGSGEGAYGELRRAGAELALPAGFTYAVLGREGSEMSDGRPTPRAHDGMAAFSLPNGNVRLVRNHEDRSAPGESVQRGDPGLAYDPRGGGGTTSLEVRLGGGEPELVRDFVSLSGTIVNCAGGPTPRGTWLSCEETTEGPSHGWERPHGYVFEVDAHSEGQVPARPLKALGRFVHEAVAVDPSTDVLYLTEDMARSGFYRFLPGEPGDLARGGELQMLAVRGEPRLTTRSGVDAGARFPVRWVPIDEPDPAEAEENELAVFEQGREQGGAEFSRLEGCWFGDGGVYFHATDGGAAGKGQVWKHAPDAEGEEGGELVLVFESPGAELLDSPDNITVSPRGGVVLCEDSPGGNHLRGLTPEGKIFDLARNVLNDREFAGAVFDPGGRVLFVNIQGDLSPGGPGNPGMTLAITGPWEDGAL